MKFDVAGCRIEVKWLSQLGAGFLVSGGTSAERKAQRPDDPLPLHSSKGPVDRQRHFSSLLGHLVSSADL